MSDTAQSHSDLWCGLPLIKKSLEFWVKGSQWWLIVDGTSQYISQYPAVSWVHLPTSGRNLIYVLLELLKQRIVPERLINCKTFIDWQTLESLYVIVHRCPVAADVK